VKTIFDLPAHPLFVHVPIVLLPLLAVVTIVAALRPDVARRLGPWLVLAAALVFISVLLAVNSGEALDRALDLGNTTTHAALARTTRWFSLGLLVVTAALWWVTRRATPRDEPGASRPTRHRPVVPMVAALAILFSVLSAVWVLRTGHEGARIHWSGILKKK
jgi:hypothetical protein